MPSPKEILVLRSGDVAEEMRVLTAKVQNESRAMNDEENTKFQDLDAEYQRLEASIKNFDRVDSLSAPVARVSEPSTTDKRIKPIGPEIKGGNRVAYSYENHGFEKGPGEFLNAVYRARMEGYRDPRLFVNAITTFGSEGTGADGGYALPPQFVQGIADAVMPEDSFLRALNTVQTNSNLLNVPVNEKAPWSTGGVTSAATAEGGAITVSKPAIRQVQVPLYKAASLVHVSDEAISDMAFLGSWVMGQMGQHLNYQIENWIMNGTGLGEPLGILKAPGLISLTDADSTATAIGAVDILTMEANLLPGGTAFWVASPTVFPAIATMKTGSAGYPLFQPDMTVASRRSILGRPYYTSEACPILNTTGDIVLVQPGGYVFATKAGGVQTATTYAFAFDQDMQSFRATVRVGGAPVLSGKVERAKSAGSTFASHFVAITGSRS